MECPKCHCVYQKEKNVPLLLIKCGHTLCDLCANSVYDGKSISCPECGSQSQVDSLSMLPKNMALLSMSQNPSSAQPPASVKPIVAATREYMCETHKKKVEAFCEDDLVLLCIDCILIDGHKAHDIRPVSQASEKERAGLQEDIDTANNLEESLNLMLSDIANFRAELGEKANSKREKVTSVFKEITNVIHERESTLKQNISNILEKEEDVLTTTASQIGEHLRSIAVFKKDALQMGNENECVLLTKSRERKVRAGEANRSPPTVSFMVNFPDVKKENELNVLWKMLSPQTTRQPTSNLYATTASYASKRTEKAKPVIKPHQDQHINFPKISKDKKKIGIEPGLGLEKILSPRREMNSQEVHKIPESSKQSQILNTSGLSISSVNTSMPGSKTPVPAKEESKVAKVPDLPRSNNEMAATVLMMPDGLGDEKRIAEISNKMAEAIQESAESVPTALITMHSQEYDQSLIPC